MAKTNFPVWFNDEQFEQYQELKKSGYVSKPFRMFVKDQFYEGIDKIKREVEQNGELEQ